MTKVKKLIDFKSSKLLYTKVVLFVCVFFLSLCLVSLVTNCRPQSKPKRLFCFSSFLFIYLFFIYLHIFCFYRICKECKFSKVQKILLPLSITVYAEIFAVFQFSRYFAVSMKPRKLKSRNIFLFLSKNHQ